MEQYPQYPQEHAEKKQMSGAAIVIIVLTSILVAAALLAVLFTFAARSIIGPEIEIEIEIGRVHSTQWFNFTIHRAERVAEFAGHTAAFGHQLWLVEITQTGTFFEAVPMGDWDWFMDSPDFRSILFMHPQFDGVPEMMPEEFWLERGQSETHIMLFEAPANAADLALYFEEYDVAGIIGALFILHLQ